MEDIADRVSKLLPKLGAAALRLSVHEESAGCALFQESTDNDASLQPGDTRKPQSNLEIKEEVWDVRDQKSTMDSGSKSSNCSHEKESEGKSHVRGPEGGLHSQATLMEAEKKDGEQKTEGRKEEKWISLRLTGQPDDSECFIRAPAGALRCEAADGLSCLMVGRSEELVSRVIRLRAQDKDAFRFPVTVAVPFCVRRRSSHRELAVKIVDEETRASYVAPVTTEITHGGQKGCFAEVRVYSLGVFAVVSCLKRETYSVPKRGLTLKIPMDPRICLNYLPGSFTAPVMAQTMVQPVDAVLLAAVKSRNDAYESVVSASPLLHLTHPNSQPLRRPLAITLPCPPNPEKKEEPGREESRKHQGGAPCDPLLPSDKVSRIFGACVRSSERSKEVLTVLGSRDAQWAVLDKVVVRNQQNGLVSFDLVENVDRLLVVRLLSPPQSCHLAALAEELEASARRHPVTVVLQRGRDDPRSVLLAALPSRDLRWELSRLRAQGCGGVVETSSEISLCEGDQLLLRFSGNITTTTTTTASTQSSTSVDPDERLTFHCQRRSQLLVRLTEVDPFGNYSSPCYKGTALFYRVTRAELEWRGDKAALRDAKLPGKPVCTLPLSLPKKVRVIHRPVATRVRICEEPEPLSDALLLWLSGELSPDETTLLVPSLHLGRGAAQLVKLRCRDSPSDQAFHVLAMWRRALPAVTRHPKVSQLAHSLAKIGRPDLAREVMLREAELTERGNIRK
ncbi:death domain-containing protein 1 isoform X2 [Fundulus heteroclitus]|uniref:death domain-containing protein 1 isoform X2 n=1 Tax=Fundulus heteroclitus TaxID=8078 RepID=UPI00165C8C5B|nr:death domain-containing protein 1 isoform X2 [Fundulus heteroclitus]